MKVGGTEQYVTAEAIADIAIGVAIESGLPELLTVGTTLILYEGCIYETPPDILNPCLTLSAQNGRQYILIIL